MFILIYNKCQLKCAEIIFLLSIIHFILRHAKICHLLHSTEELSPKQIEYVYLRNESVSMMGLSTILSLSVDMKIQYFDITAVFVFF